MSGSFWISVIGMTIIFIIMGTYSIYIEKRDSHSKRSIGEIHNENKKRKKKV